MNIRDTKHIDHAINDSSRAWAAGKIRHIEPFLPETGAILDIGSGRGMVTQILRERGYDVIPLDVKDRSLIDSARPVLYDGNAIPFETERFDCALLLTVLHHTPDPIGVIREAARVARQILIIEDVYSNPVQKYLTLFTDSLFNLEFRGHPHTNKTDPEWRCTFSDLGLELAGAEERHVLLFYRQFAYNLFCRTHRGSKKKAPD